MILDTPTITIAGHDTSSSWTTTSRVALDDIAITWGRNSHYDPAKAAQLRITLIDPDGHLSSAGDLGGRLITVTRGDGRIIFRGRLDDYTITPQYITDPDTNQRRRVWRLELSAACKLAELAQAILAGPGNVALLVQQFGPNYWETQSPAARIAALLARGANQIVAAISWANPFPAGGALQFTRYRRFADQMSVLDHIEAIYGIIPFAHTNYDPSTNEIAPAKPATTAGLELEWDGDTLTLDIPDGEIIPARIVGTPSGYQAKTGIDESIDVVQVVTPQLGPSTGYEIVDTAVERTTARFAPATRGRRIHTVKSDLFYNVTPPQDWQVQVADAMKPMIDAINGRLRLPTLRFDWRRFSYTPEISAALIDSFDKPIPLYFPGSIFNIIADAGSAHQVIGGVLRWQGGWVLDAVVAPAIGVGETVTVDELVSIDAPTMSDYSPDITLADLGNVTTGVTA